MANKPTVTLTLAGDEKRLAESFDRVGQASEKMTTKVTSTSKELEKAGSKFADMGERTDEAEKRQLGFHDTLDGVTSGLAAFGDSSLSTSDKLIALSQSGADLAGGITNFLLPTLENAATFMKGPLKTAMTFISEHPLLITIGLLTAAVIFLISQTDWFQNVATRVFNWVNNLARNVFGATVQWIVDRWNDVVGFFENLPSNLGKALSSIGSFIGNAFKAGLNVAVDVINWFVDRINNIVYGINVISPFDDIPPVPHLQRLHGGGVFHAPGAAGEGIALLKDGETVSGSGQGGGGWRVTGSGALFEVIQAAIFNGDIQLEGR